MSNPTLEALVSTPPTHPITTTFGGRPTTTTASWMPFAGATRISTTSEEDTFRSRLEASTSRTVRDVRRRDITAVLNALRCGLSLDDLLERAPGLDPSRLDDAYRHLDALRTASVLAWTDIVAEPSLEMFARRSAVARLLLPRPVSILRQIMQEDPDEFETVTTHLREAVSLADDAVTAVEERIVATPDDGARLGRLLYDADGSGIANWPTYLPRRVGMLSPARVAALLGERTERSQFESVRATSDHRRAA